MRRMISFSAFALSLVATNTMAASVPNMNDILVQAPKVLNEDQRLVKVSDLNLGSAEGRSVLMHRVNFAVTSLCDASRFSVADPTGSLACSKEAWASVQPQLAQVLPRN